MKMCVRHGVDVIYHASYIDDEGMNMLEAKKTKHVVAPGINWLIATRKCLAITKLGDLLTFNQSMMLPLSGILMRRLKKLATRKNWTPLSVDCERCIEEE